jgi:hypothetical protein
MSDRVVIESPYGTAAPRELDGLRGFEDSRAMAVVVESPYGTAAPRELDGPQQTDVPRDAGVLVSV